MKNFELKMRWLPSSGASAPTLLWEHTVLPQIPLADLTYVFILRKNLTLEHSSLQKIQYAI